MTPPAPLSTRAWIVVPLLALGFLIWSGSQRVQRIHYVTTAVSGDAVVSTASPTGYAGGIRDLIVPEQNYDSCQWIVQTQQMLAQREWRVRQIDYENAPVGREVFTPSPYRWWLGLVAGIDHAVSGRPLGQSVERAALLADPLLHILLLLGSVLFTAWRFGTLPAALLAVGVTILFPFAAGFLPGIPDDKTLSRACALLSLLMLLAGTRPARGAGAPAGAERPSPWLTARWFFAAGVAGGFGLWISVADQVPVILGIAVGAVLAAGVLQRDRKAAPTRILSPTDWLAWSLGGAASSLGFYLVEYYPTHLGSWRLQVIHPLYSLAWLGLGVGLMLLTAWLRGEGTGRRIRTGAGAALAVASLAALPLVTWKSHTTGFLATDVWSFRLARLPGSADATSLWAWLGHDGLSPMVWAALLPALLIVPAGWLLLRQGTAATGRASVALVVGPVLVTLGFACWQLGRWSSFDAGLLALLIAVTAVLREEFAQRFKPWLWSVCLGLALAPGAFLLWPPTGSPDKTPLSDSELSGLIARDLAHWLAKRTGTGKTVVLAPPNETTALYYYGGLPGIGTLSWENQAAIGAAARIFSSTTPQEALVRIQRRGVTHIVVPSWDRYLDEYVRLNVVQVADAFLAGLRNWALLPWLRPLAYQLPAVPGYEDQSVAVFEVVEEQDEVTLLSWQAEFFAEQGRLEYAAAVSQSLQRFPADPGALIARAQVAMARRDAAGFGEALQALTARLAAGADRTLPWDRRISLATVLAQGRQMDLAREQVRRCLADVDETRLRSASTASLYRLLVIAKMFGLEIGDPSLRALARELLPLESRSRL